MELPAELRLESYERRANAAVFDRLDLVVAFRPGKNGTGAVVKSFLDAIKCHDEIVVKLEAFMSDIDEMKKGYKKKNRLFRNLDSAWNVILENPVDYYEYLALLPKMENIEQQLEEAIDPVVRVELVALHSRFKALQPLCSKQLLIYTAYSKAREERDAAVRQLVEAEKELTRLRENEKLLAALISDDHIMGDELKKPLSIVFPNVQVGYILVKINGEHLEELPYDEVIVRVRRARSPHNAVFMRYDYRYDPFEGIWRSLQELRDLGVCVEDPLLQKMHMISLAAQGDVSGVQQLLARGEDPNGADLTGNTAMVAAATSKREDVVKLLFRVGADINLTDKNMMTPLLYCANRGQTQMVQLLLDLGADRSHTDRNLRGPMFYAVLSGVLAVVQQFFKVERKDVAERLWGFTALHLAANQGELDIVEYLLSQGCSIYKLDKKGRTAEEVAKECGHIKVLQRLIDERLGAPGQLVHVFRQQQAAGERTSNDDDSVLSTHPTSWPVQIWIGDVGAMEVSWCADVDVTAVLYLRRTENQFPPHSAWLRKDDGKKKKASVVSTAATAAASGSSVKSSSSKSSGQGLIKFRSVVVPDTLEDGDNNDNWLALQTLLPEMLSFVQEVIRADGTQKLVICDESCKSLAPAVAAIFILLLDQVRIKDGFLTMHKARPGIELGRDIRLGLQDLQVQMDTKVLRRLNKKTRDSVACSLAF